MAEKKTSPFFIGLALVVIGIIELLGTLKILVINPLWWWAIILIIVGVLVIINIKKGTVCILGWICLVYGVVLLLMAIGLFHVVFILNLHPAAYILFGLILLL